MIRSLLALLVLAAAPAAAQTVPYASDPSALPAEWRVAYTPVAFAYPAGWTVDTSVGEQGLLVQLTRPVPGYPAGESSEIFAAFPFRASEATLDAEIETALQTYGAWMQQVWPFPGFARRNVEVAGTVVPGLAFEGATDPDETVWGRLAIVPLVREAGQVKGVGLVLVGSTLAPEIRSVDDVGVNGGLATILATLRAGSVPGAAPSYATAPASYPAAAPASYPAATPAAYPAAAPAGGGKAGAGAGPAPAAAPYAAPTAASPSPAPVAAAPSSPAPAPAPAGNALSRFLVALGGAPQVEAMLNRLLGESVDPNIRVGLSGLLSRLQAGAAPADILAALTPLLAGAVGGGGAPAGPTYSAPSAAASPGSAAPPAGKPSAQ